MKSLTVREAEGQLADLIAEACRGQTVVLVDGERRVTLQPQTDLDVEENSPELESELLKAVNGPHTPFQENELREIAERARREPTARARQAAKFQEPGSARIAFLSGQSAI